MAVQEASTPYSSLIYLGAGDQLSLEDCRQTAANTWLVEASHNQAQRLRRAIAGHVGIRVEEAVVAAHSGQQTFHEYNLPWASGLNLPDKGLQRLYPGLRCLTSEPREGVGIGELVERCLTDVSQADSERGALLVIDLGEQAGELLQALEEAGQLAHLACVAVVPPHRQGLDILPPPSLHGPLSLPDSLTWLSEGSRCYQPHPLLLQLQRAMENSRQLTQQLEERTQQRDTQRQQRE
ncbi:hypothetical protein, partial [Halomonas halocynthiae]|uniref:hypothetical protein n=1 Tax=Halomonas halocynthiae TaxID=176290 RepID=UPI00054D2756